MRLFLLLVYATFLSKSNIGQREQRLFSPFLYFLQQLLLQFLGISSKVTLSFFFSFSFLSFFLPTLQCVS